MLAGGQGRRLAGLTGGIPKQYFAPRGGLTLLEDTLDRLAPLADASRAVTVIDQAHRDMAASVSARTSLGQIAPQPLDRGTANGVLFGLTELAADPEDLVILTPSDHGVASARMFRTGLRRAVRAITAGPAEIVLFAAAPEGPSADLGWILPERASAPQPGDLPQVGAFVEKPGIDLARRLFMAGAGWNTMVLAARVASLLALFRHHASSQAAVFDQARRLPRSRRRAFLEEVYADLPRADFSRNVLTPAVGLRLYTWPQSLGWTDLGTPERLATWLDQHARRLRDDSTQPAKHPTTR